MSAEGHKQRVGRWGENVAASYLEGRGYRVVARNFRTRFGEIDLIARKGELTIFVEVKTRSGLRYGDPESSVNYYKRDHLLRTIQAYWQDREAETAWRVDVVAITGRPNSKDVQIEHFENALTA